MNRHNTEPIPACFLRPRSLERLHILAALSSPLPAVPALVLALPSCLLEASFPNLEKGLSSRTQVHTLWRQPCSGGHEGLPSPIVEACETPGQPQVGIKMGLSCKRVQKGHQSTALCPLGLTARVGTTAVTLSQVDRAHVWGQEKTVSACGHQLRRLPLRERKSRSPLPRDRKALKLGLQCPNGS